MISKIILGILKNILILLVSRTIFSCFDKYGKESGERYISPKSIKDDLQELYLTIKKIMCFTLIMFVFIISLGTFELNAKKFIQHIFYAGNVIVLLAFWWLIKHGSKKKKRKEKEKGNIENFIMEQMLSAYEYDGQFGRYFLKEEFVTIRELIQKFRYVVLSVFFWGYNLEFLIDGGLAVCIYPVFTVICIHEICMYLSGLSKEEYCKLYYDCEKEEAEEVPVVGLYHGLKEEIEKGELIKWGERKRQTADKNSEDVDKEEESERKLLMKFLEGKEYDSYKLKYLIEPAIAALKKRNVIFKTFFYRDLDWAFFFPVYQRILEGEKCLVVTDKNLEMVWWMQKKFERMCGIYDFVCIKELPEAKESDDIIILGYNEVRSFRKSELFEMTADSLGTIFMLEPSKHIQQELEAVKEIKEYSEKMCGQPNIIIADSQRELEDKIVFLRDDDTVYWGSYGMHPRQSVIVCWDADAVGEEEGGILELRVIQALLKKKTSEDIIWIYGDKRAAVDIWWQFRYEKGEPKGCSVLTEKDGKELTTEKDAYFIIEDMEYNYNKVAERYLTRAREKELINIISPDYLLRNFMAAHQEDRNIREILSKTISPEPEIQMDKNTRAFGILQKYLPGQYMVKDGKRYRITHIEEKGGKYKIQKVPDLDHGGNRVYYRQNRSYKLKQTEERKTDSERPLWQSDKIEMFLERADITGRTHGYLEMPEFNNLHHANKVEAPPDMLERNYNNRQYIRWQLRGTDGNVLAYFAALLKEMLYTLCPDFIDYISLGIVGGGDRKTVLEGLNGVVAEIIGEDLKDELLSIYLIEDNECESGIIPAIAKRWNVIYRLIGMYVKWSIEIRCKYLTYGNDEEIENIQEVLKSIDVYFMQDFAGEENETKTEEAEKTKDVVETKEAEETRSEAKTKDATKKEEAEEIKDAAESEETIEKKYTAEAEAAIDTKETETKEINGEKNVKEQDKPEHFEVRSEEEAEKIFKGILLDLFYFEELHVNIPLRPAFVEKGKKTGEVLLRLNVDYRSFYWECAYGILKAYYQQKGYDEAKADKTSREYAQKYLELVWTCDDKA